MHDLIRRGRRRQASHLLIHAASFARRGRAGGRDCAAHGRRSNPQLVLAGRAVRRGPRRRRVSLARQIAFALSGRPIHRSPARFQGRALDGVLLQRSTPRLARRRRRLHRRISAKPRRIWRDRPTSIAACRFFCREPRTSIWLWWPSRWGCSGCVTESSAVSTSARRWFTSTSTVSSGPRRKSPMRAAAANVPAMATAAAIRPPRIPGTRRPAISIPPPTPRSNPSKIPTRTTPSTSPDGSAKADAKSTEQLPPGTQSAGFRRKRRFSRRATRTPTHRRAPIPNPGSRTARRTPRMPRTRTSPAIPADNSSLASKLRDALSNLLAKMKPQSKQGGGKPNDSSQSASSRSSQQGEKQEGDPKSRPGAGRRQRECAVGRRAAARRDAAGFAGQERGTQQQSAELARRQERHRQAGRRQGRSRSRRIGRHGKDQRDYRQARRQHLGRSDGGSLIRQAAVEDPVFASATPRTPRPAARSIATKCRWPISSTCSSISRRCASCRRGRARRAGCEASARLGIARPRPRAVQFAVGCKD